MAPRVVGVIFSLTDFRRALRMRNPPDLFELRLDGLLKSLDAVRTGISKLPAPLIITARHPREGGANFLSASTRRSLLLDFMPYAAYVDIEARALPFFGPVLQAAAGREVSIIVSFHDLQGTPGPSRLDKFAAAARSAGASIIKIATRTDTAAQLGRLVEFFDRHRRAARLAAMGMGKLGRSSRVDFAHRGSVLSYAYLGHPQAQGQLSVRELRTTMSAALRTRVVR